MDYGENKMKQTLVFQLDKPTQKKWETWQALTPITNEICNKYGLINQSRIYCKNLNTVTCVYNAPDNEAIFKCHYEVSKIEHLHSVPSTCISAKQCEAPEVVNLKLNLTLSEGQRNLKTFELWTEVARTIDAQCRMLNIYVKRTPDVENFSMYLDISFTNHFDWSYLSYFAGNACGKAGLELLHYESIVDPVCEDILDKITYVTGKHKQLSFLPKLKQA